MKEIVLKKQEKLNFKINEQQTNNLIGNPIRYVNNKVLLTKPI